MEKYKDTISLVQKKEGSLLDAIIAVQELYGYVSETAMGALAQAFKIAPTQVYETASFYSMIRFAPVGRIIIKVCHNAPCHVAGAGKTIAALENALGIQMGETTKDGKYSLEYTECIGQCQASPSILINGNTYSNITVDKVPELLKAIV